MIFYSFLVEKTKQKKSLSFLWKRESIELSFYRFPLAWEWQINLKYMNAISIDKSLSLLQRNILCSLQNRNCIRCAVYWCNLFSRGFPASPAWRFHLFWNGLRGLKDWLFFVLWINLLFYEAYKKTSEVFKTSEVYYYFINICSAIFLGMM